MIIVMMIEKIRNLNDHCNDDCNSSLELSDLTHERKIRNLNDHCNDDCIFHWNDHSNDDFFASVYKPSYSDLISSDLFCSDLTWKHSISMH